MGDLVDAIDAIERFMEQELGDVHEIALRSKVGGGAEWDGLLSHLGLVPADATARAERISAFKMKTGALPGEVRMAFHVIGSMVSGQLARLEQRWPEVQDDNPPLAGRVRAIRARLVGIVEREGSRYDKQVQPNKKEGHVGSIFANVHATKGMRPWENIQWKYALTIQCPGCGSPQEVATQFTCAFCAGDLLGRRDLFEEYSA
jgi:hypothetical protein